MKEFYIGIGSRIKEQRLAQNLTRDKLAHMSRISDKFLYDIELGRKGMSAETLYKVAKALGVTTDWLFGNEPLGGFACHYVEIEKQTSPR